MADTSQSADFYDREYNPRAQIPEFLQYFARWKTDAAATRALLQPQLDLRYGPAAGETLDYFPAADRQAPLLIFIHGGYWRALDKADFSWIARSYVASGAAVAIVNYGLLPATSLREIIEQLRRACIWLFDHAEALGFDRHRMVCSGHSAGGHLTAMMMATDWTAIDFRLPRRLLAAAVTLSGIFDLAPLLKAEFLRHDLQLDAAEARALSPLHAPCRNVAPLLLSVGALESGEFHRQSAQLAHTWTAAVITESLDVGGCNHLSVCDAFAQPGNVLFEATSRTLHVR